jgi:serine/threonine protein kinase
MDGIFSSFLNWFTSKPFWKFNIFIIFFFNLQVEQLHKIFKLCGSPSDDFWKRSKLSNATMFKPQHPYESSLQERCKDIPAAALDLMETLLSIEPEKRGTASAALLSQVSLTKTNPLTLQFPD